MNISDVRSESQPIKLKNGAYGIIVAPFENDDKIITESLNYDNFIAPANIPTFQ